MKGVIFTEFIELVEEKFGFAVADQIISESTLESGGVYTSVGTYNFSEMLQLLTNLSKASNIPPSELLFVFGKHLFGRFHHLYTHFFEGKKNTFEFLCDLENYIHTEVLKLYPDAELPTIDTQMSSDAQSMQMVYHSSRKLSDLAFGLIEGCADHFGEKIKVEKVDEMEQGSKVVFLLTRI